MVLVLFGLWMLLEGRWTVETVLTGIVLSTLVYLFCWKFLDYSPRREWAVIRRIPRAVGYLFWLIGQIFVSGFMTISRIWSGREVRPHLVSFRSALRTDPGRVLLSQSITLTPGTLTVDQRNGRFLVHALDDAYTEGLQDSEMEKRILELEKK
jgi:multicomponent Na+:H+ antiporter subunit E